MFKSSKVCIFRAISSKNNCGIELSGVWFWLFQPVAVIPEPQTVNEIIMKAPPSDHLKVVPDLSHHNLPFLQDNEIKSLEKNSWKLQNCFNPILLFFIALVHVYVK